MNVVVTPDALRAMGVPGRRPETYAEEVSRWLNFFHIDTPTRVAHFFGQVLHESGAMQFMRELPSQFVSSRIRYAGRGMTQLTTLPNYEAYRNYLRTHSEVPYVDVVARPNLVETTPYSVHSAMWYWDKENANRYADVPVTRANVERIVRLVLRPNIRAYHTDSRLRYAQLAEAATDQGLIRFEQEYPPNAPATAPAAFQVIKNGSHTIKNGTSAKPSDTLALFKLNETTGKDELNPAGVVATAALGLLAALL